MKTILFRDCAKSLNCGGTQAGWLCSPRCTGVLRSFSDSPRSCSRHSSRRPVQRTRSPVQNQTLSSCSLTTSALPTAASIAGRASARRTLTGSRTGVRFSIRSTCSRCARPFRIADGTGVPRRADKAPIPSQSPPFQGNSDLAKDAAPVHFEPRQIQPP